MRRRRAAALQPRTARPPRRLCRPSASMTPQRLTEELAAWSATLAAHEYPPVILERLRLFTLDGLVPLDWADQEARQRRASQRHLAEREAAGAPLVGR